MPHDANGKLLKVGDTVNVRCQVQDIFQTEEYCNLTLKTNLPMFPGTDLTTIVLNAKQVFRVDGEPPT